MTEEWKDIEGYDGYRISNFGRVTGRQVKMLKINYATKYPTVRIYSNGISKDYLVHVLVWNAFGDRPIGDLTIDHIDNDKANSRIDNLQLLTNRENVLKGKLAHTKSSRFTGVHYEAKRRKWVAEIIKDKIKFRLGRFNCETVAALTYQKKSIELYGNPTKF